MLPSHRPQNTAKSCIESGAFFCVDASGYDAIGCYLASGCTKANVILSIAHGQMLSDGNFHWHDEVMEELKGGVQVEEVDKELGIVVAEFEFPTYYQYFIKRKKATFICTKEAKEAKSTSTEAEATTDNESGHSVTDMHALACDSDDDEGSDDSAHSAVIVA